MADKEQPKESGVGKQEPAHPLVKLCNFTVLLVVQQKGGVIIKGTAKWFRKGYLKLTDAEVVGLRHQTKVKWILIDHQSIAHVHPVSEVEEVAEP